MFRIVSLAAALLVALPAQAQDRTPEIDAIFSWATPSAPGCAVAASHNGKLVANRAYGSADLERNIPLTTNSVFDIGSLRKQFIAASVLLLVEDGRLSLSDDIRKHFPELPDYGRPITIDHLLTHTSGIRDWTGLLALAGGNADVLSLILRQRGLNFAPGEEWSYSNSGYVLLKELVQRVSGTPFAEFARQRLFEPLGMTKTRYIEDLEEVVEHRALAYAKEGGAWKQDMLVGAERGGGGALLSTASDLLIWNDGLTNRKLGAGVTAKLEEPVKLNNGRQLTYARGLIVDTDDGVRAVVHTGGAGGYSSWLGRIPQYGLSLAVLCNADEMGTSTLANRIVDLFLPAEVKAASDARIAAARAEGKDVDLTGKAGLFFAERTGEPLQLVVNNGRLQILGGPPLLTVDANRFRNQRHSLFFMSQDSFELRFASPDVIELTSMEGKVTRYTRARPYAPTPAELQAFAGRFESSEIGTVMHVVPGTGALVWRFELAPDKTLPFRPVAPDVFQAGRMMLRFQRNAGGKVVGFAYSNPVVRRIDFARIGDLPAQAAKSIAESPATPAAPATARASRPDATPGATPDETRPVALEALAGYYELVAGRGIVVTVENGKLFGEPTGNAKRELALQSGTTYAVVGAPVPMTVTFVMRTDGGVTEMVMRRGGEERRLPKVR